MESNTQATGGMRYILTVGSPAEQTFEIEQQVLDNFRESTIATGFRRVIAQTKAYKQDSATIRLELNQADCPEFINEIVAFMKDPSSFDPEQWSSERISRLWREATKLKMPQLVEVCLSRVKSLVFKEKLSKSMLIKIDGDSLRKRFKNEDKFVLIFDGACEDPKEMYRILADYLQRFQPGQIETLRYFHRLQAYRCPANCPDHKGKEETFVPDGTCILYVPDQSKIMLIVPDPEIELEGDEDEDKDLPLYQRPGNGYKIVDLKRSWIR